MACLSLRDQFQRVFDMDVDEAHRHFGYWDRARRGRVSSVELWGAMALCCAEREEVKINFCFCELLDLDKDGALNEVELRLLLQSFGVYWGGSSKTDKSTTTGPD